MSIREDIETVVILPNELLGRMLQVEKYKRNAAVAIMTLIEQKQREENKESYFEEFQINGIRANEEQKKNVTEKFMKIQKKIEIYYGPDFVEFYENEIIRNLFPEEADGIIETRKIIKKDLDETNS